MYRPHGYKNSEQLLERLVKDDAMTYFPEFNLLVVSSSFDPSEGPYNRTTAIFNASPSEIASGDFFKDCDYVYDTVFYGGQDKAISVFDTFKRDADGNEPAEDPRIRSIAKLFAWSPTIETESLSDMRDAAGFYLEHELSDREFRDYVRRDALVGTKCESNRSLDSEELLEKITSGETVSYFPEFNLLITTVDYDPFEEYDRMSATFNVFPSELAYGELFHGFENVVDIPYSGPAIDPIGFCGTFSGDKGESRVADVSLAGLAELLAGRDVISTQSVPELLDTMADRFGLEPEERARIAERAQAKEQARTQGPDIKVEIDNPNDDNFIEGTVTVEGESCYFYCPNSARDTEDYDSVIFEPFRPVGYEGDIEDVALPTVIEENREIVELVVSVTAAPYMDPDKLPSCEQSLDSLCDEKTDEAQSMRYGMEGVGLPMLDAAEHLANY